MLISLLMPSVFASNFDESYRGKIPETFSIEEDILIRIRLDEVSSDLTIETNLTFETALEDPLWTFKMEGVKYTEDFSDSNSTATVVFNHGKFDNITISLSGVAPTYEKRKTILLIDIEQTEESDDTSTDIIKPIYIDITTEAIEDVRSARDLAKEAIEDANETIANASAIGVDVSDILDTLELARHHLDRANELYSEEDTDESLEFANNAYSNATKAINLAQIKTREHEEHQNFIKWMNYGIIIAIVIAAVIVVVILFRQRAWDKLGR